MVVVGFLTGWNRAARFSAVSMNKPSFGTDDCEFPLWRKGKGRRGRGRWERVCAATPLRGPTARPFANSPPRTDRTSIRERGKNEAVEDQYNLRDPRFDIRFALIAFSNCRRNYESRKQNRQTVGWAIHLIYVMLVSIQLCCKYYITSQGARMPCNSAWRMLSSSTDL